MSEKTAAIVDTALRAAGVPIDGVTVGDASDRATWRVAFQAVATPGHRATAATVLTTVAIDAAAEAAEDKRVAQLQVDASPQVLRAVILTLVDDNNLLRTEINTLRAAVIPPLTPPVPFRTPAQIFLALRIKAGM